MKQGTYQSICKYLNEQRDTIVAAKRPEYTEGNVDVLNNFKVVANELGIEPIKVWYVYFRKHIASISQYAKDPTRQMAEPIDTRFMDAMNYLELGFAILHDKES